MRGERIGAALTIGVLLLLPVQFVVHRAARAEPYPALYMPPFGGVPQTGDGVVVNRLELVAQSAGNGPVEVDPFDLMPNKTKLAESIASAFFADEEAVRRAAADGWLAARLRDIGIRATSMQVTRRRDLVTGDHRITGSQVVATFTVQVGGAEQ